MAPSEHAGLELLPAAAAAAAATAAALEAAAAAAIAVAADGDPADEPDVPYRLSGNPTDPYCPQT